MCLDNWIFIFKINERLAQAREDAELMLRYEDRDEVIELDLQSRREGEE